MGNGKQEFASPQEALAHYGVKGMHWGVRKREKPSQKNTRPSKVKPLSKSFKKDVTNYSNTFVEKFESPDQKQRLTSQQKKTIAYGIAGSLAAAAIIGGAYYYKTRGGKTPDLSGLESYKNSLRQSRLNAIKNNFVDKTSFDRPTFTLPAGHQFYRVSGGKETTFGSVTYASHTLDDFNRYVSELGHSLNNKVTFKTTAPLHVASLNDSLDVLKDVMSSNSKSSVTKDEALSMYRDLVGGGWKDSISSDFFSALKKKGFGAIVDDMDAGVISESPLVIFDHSSMTKKKSSPMSMADIRKAESMVKDFVNRK